LPDKVVAAIAQQEVSAQNETPANNSGYPTDEQIKTLWDAYKEGPDAFRKALAQNSKREETKDENAGRASGNQSIPILYPISIEPLPSVDAPGSTPGDAGEAINDRCDDAPTPEPSRREGASLMFIPNELDIEGRPELRKLPASVLFAEVGANEGARVLGSALYEPDLSSLYFDGGECTLRYQNKHGGDSSVRITYHVGKQMWEGEKSVAGKIVGVALGADWKHFFTQLTLLGLAKGEACVMERVAVSSR
jgi:hypothetical protein